LPLDAGVDGSCKLPIGAQQMRRVMLGHKSELAGGRARMIDDQVGFDAAFELFETGP
jgi:hypothetical protein